jgi:hypothetical protein
VDVLEPEDSIVNDRKYENRKLGKEDEGGAGEIRFKTNLAELA